MAYEPVRISTAARGKTNFQGRTITGFKLDNVQVEGLDELIDQFMSLGEDMIFKLGDATVEAANVVMRKAMSKAPFKTGALQGGIVVQKPGRNRRGHKAYQIFAKVQLTKDAAHGTQVELGHKFSGYFWKQADKRRVEAKPFLRPAADESKNEVASIITDAMNKILAEYGGK